MKNPRDRVKAGTSIPRLTPARRLSPGVERFLQRAATRFLGTQACGVRGATPQAGRVRGCAGGDRPLLGPDTAAQAGCAGQAKTSPCAVVRCSQASVCLRLPDVENAVAYAAATLRAISNSPSGIGTDSRQVNATGRSPRWST